MSNSAQSSPEEQTSFATVIGLWAAGLGAAAQFGKVSVSFSMLSEVYGTAGAKLGFAVSLVGFVGVLFGVVAGLIVASIGYRRALIVALALGALVSAWQATLPSLSLFLFSRALEGASHLAIVIAAPTLVAQISAPRHRGLTLSLWSTFFGVAFFLLVLMGLPLARAYGPGALYAAHGIYMAAMALMVAVMLPRDVVGPKGAPLTLRSVLADHIRIYCSPWRNAPALGWFFYAATWVAVLTIMPQFLPEGATRDSVVAFMPLAGICSSMTIGVLLLRYLPAVTVIRIGFLACAVASLAIWSAPENPFCYIGLALCLGLVQGSSFTSIPQLNDDPVARAEANGALAQMGNVGTTSGTPILAALVGAWGATGFLIFALTLYCCGFLVHMLLAQRRRRATL